MIRRGDITYIAQLNEGLIINQHVTALLIWLRHITVQCFRKPQNKHFTYHRKAHTISNKLVSKESAQKKGGKSYDSYKYVFKFLW